MTPARSLNLLFPFSVVTGLMTCLLGAGHAAAQQTVDFTRDIAPIFSKSCQRCHGPKKQEGGLALHVQDRAMAGGDSGPAIVPGKSAESRLIRYVAGLDEDNTMPPEGAGDPLTPAQVGLLRAWIDQGARWSETAQARAAGRRALVVPASEKTGAARRSRTPAGPATRSTASCWPGWRRRG